MRRVKYNVKDSLDRIIYSLDSETTYKNILPKSVSWNKGIIENHSEKSYLFSGAGILLLEQSYQNDKGRKEPAVILFRSACSKSGYRTYQDLGGYAEEKDMESPLPLTKTAIREAKEESQNLISVEDKFRMRRIVSSVLPYVEVEDSAKYRCHIVTVSPKIIKSVYFYHNRDIIKKHDVPTHWKEMDRMTRFYVSDLFPNIFKESRSLFTDVYGVDRCIRGRTRKCLAKMLNGLDKNESMMNILIGHPYNAKLTVDDGSTFDFLKGTYKISLWG
jgi:hypothetical protein